MGQHTSKKAAKRESTANAVSLNDFTIVRAIGKGAFGKVCIVQKRKNRRNYALKYMNKMKCLQKEAFRNVQREIDLLADLSHPFLVNLWFTFQDEEDMFMVSDLLLGGDLRYHLNQEGRFSEDRAKLYICEVALALSYLHNQRVLHRDVKPDNMLLDDQGHAHLTDFNVATRLTDGCLATSITGTKPYMAPEIFATAIEQRTGYSFAVDWWSLGACFYEMLRGRRPFEINPQLTNQQAYDVLTLTPLAIPVEWSDDLISFIGHLLNIDSTQRIRSAEDLSAHPYMARIDLKAVLRKKMAPVFIPNADTLNCDPTFELEEMIIESKPLHKKKKRMKKRDERRRSNQGKAGDAADNNDKQEEEDAAEAEHLAAMETEFKVYNREELLKDEEQRIKKLEEELGIVAQNDALNKRLRGAVE